MVKKIALCSVVLVMALLLWQWLFPSEEEKIRRQFKNLAVQVSKKQEESAVIMALKMKKIQQSLAPSCAIIMEERNFRQSFAPSDISRFLIAFRNYFPNLEASFSDLNVTIQENKAHLEATITLKSNASGDQEALLENHLIHFQLDKGEEQWHIINASLPPALAR